MKVVLFISILAFSACGKVKSPKQALNIGKDTQEQRVDWTIEQESSLEETCKAIYNKTRSLPDLSGHIYTFDYSTSKSCKDSKMEPPTTIQTRMVEHSPNRWRYQTLGNQAFAFQEIETEHTGVMSEICKKRGQGYSPIESEVYGVINVVMEEKCATDSACFKIDRGPRSSAGWYVKEVREALTVKVRNSYRGFVTKRAMISRGLCEGKQTMTKRAVLKF